MVKYFQNTEWSGNFRILPDKSDYNVSGETNKPVKIKLITKDK
jgi:hypothetical protein